MNRAAAIKKKDTATKQKGAVIKKKDAASQDPTAAS
jgi:hypothetical protein